MLRTITDNKKAATDNANGMNTKKFSRNATHKTSERSNANVCVPNRKLYEKAEFPLSFSLKKISVHTNKISMDVMEIT